MIPIETLRILQLANPGLAQTIMDMVNNEGYPLHDIAEFIEEYGVEAFEGGYYAKWSELSEEGHTEGAIKAFVEEFGIEEIELFEECYLGEYNSPGDWAEEFYTDNFVGADVERLMEHVVIDWEATFSEKMYDSFTHIGGFMFQDPQG